MLATSTHDSKRSEDVRARIDAISEMPAPWRLAVRRWARTNRSKKRTVAGHLPPSCNDEYLLYQTLVGTFPAQSVETDALSAYRERIERYMLQAVREAKVHSSWINPNDADEVAVVGFVSALLGRLEGDLFMDDFRAQAGTFAWFGALNSSSIALIKFTSPGVPDIYQGQEMVKLALVDPANRRPVDFTTRREALAALKVMAADSPPQLAAQVRALLDTVTDGRAKLWTAWRALNLRRLHPDVFERGDYCPVAADGARANHVVAYARRLGETGIVTIAPRLFASLGLGAGLAPVGIPAWADTSIDLSILPAGTRLDNVLTGESFVTTGSGLALASVLANFPAALLVYRPDAS